MSATAAPTFQDRGRLVVDASVVIKWHVPEIHGPAALRLLDDRAPELHVPDLVYPEVGNILWKKLRRDELDEGQARRVAHLVAIAPLEAHPAGPLMEAALEIAIVTGRTVYDSLYMALAARLQCPMVTADKKLFNATRDGPMAPLVGWIEEDFQTDQS